MMRTAATATAGRSNSRAYSRRLRLPTPERAAEIALGDLWITFAVDYFDDTLARLREHARSPVHEAVRNK